MEHRNPTKKEIDEAKEYLARRIEAADEVKSECEELFEEAALRIIAIVRKYRKPGSSRHIRVIGHSRCAVEIQAVVDWLLEEIASITRFHCVPDEDDSERRSDVVHTIFDEEDHGATFDERIQADRSLLLLALSSKARLESIDLSLDDDDLAVSMLDSISKTSHRLELLAINTVATGWMLSLAMQAKSDGKSGYFIINGSAPCKYCASIEGFHPIDTPMLIPAHPHCRCIVVYI